MKNGGRSRTGKSVEMMFFWQIPILWLDIFKNLLFVKSNSFVWNLTLVGKVAKSLSSKIWLKMTERSEAKNASQNFNFLFLSKISRFSKFFRFSFDFWSKFNPLKVSSFRLVLRLDSADHLSERNSLRLRARLEIQVV